MFLQKKKKNDWSKLEMEENILDISLSLSLWIVWTQTYQYFSRWY